MALFQKEKQEILALTETETVNELLTEKISVAADIINQQVIELNGSNLSTYSYDLGDNCELTIKLQDRAETDGLYTSIMPMATSGSEELWKNYGDRYFTAVASVKCNVATASFRLENHYTLSSAGIDERPGKAFATWTLGDGLLAVDNPVITDSSARTVGASDVNMHCIFTCKSGSAGPDKYKVNTTVKYISHDKTGKRIKVGQVWNLTKVS